MRCFFFASFFCALIFSACRKSEKFIDTGFRFAALSQGPEFSLDAVPITVSRVVVNFYTPDCPPCEKEIPALQKFYEKYKRDATVGFYALGSSLKAVNVGAKSAKDPPVALDSIRSELQVFAQRYALNYPQYVSGESGLKAWRVTGFPETFVFIRTGASWQLKRKYISEINYEELDKAVEVR